MNTTQAPLPAQAIQYRLSGFGPLRVAYLDSLDEVHACEHLGWADVFTRELIDDAITRGDVQVCEAPCPVASWRHGCRPSYARQIFIGTPMPGGWWSFGEPR